MQHRVIDQLRDSQLPRITVNKIRDINHHIRKDLDILFLCLDPDIRNRSILDRICHLYGDLITCRRQNFSCRGIYHVFCQDMPSDPVSEH